ncbi:MAG: ankyrin repeat domain-containing protein, partial [Cyclobacteriaceae bacterium]|nr:ankyrin repeat domain-containing protein [Cyclobacteriaceae bacterium]
LTDGRTDLVFDLINQGTAATATDTQGTSLIKWCAYYGDVSAIKYLIANGASLDDLGANYDLNGAAFHGHWQLCQYLLEQRADANHALLDTGETALHSCMQVNRPSTNLIIKLLLAYGADPNVQTKPKVATGAFMRDAFTKQETPLHRAAAFGNEEAIQLLLDTGADKSIRDMNGDSPLSWASWHKRPGTILSLLTYGEHRIHSLHIQNMQSDHGSGWGSGMSIMRMGKVHLEK